MQRVLAVIAHPDDEALGCGGRLAKLSDAGCSVSVLLPVRRCDERGLRLWSDLTTGLRRSCDILGAGLIELESPLDEIHAESHTHRLHDLILPYVAEADLVLTHWTGDANQVHRGVARAVEVATRPFRRRKDVSLFEVLTSTGQGFGSSGPAFSPTEYVELTSAQARRKQDAIACYPSEATSGRGPEDVERQMKSRGAEIGVPFAEAYVVARRFA
jgi:LmbE family N-acetylglucosaminyl deacetylase